MDFIPSHFHTKVRRELAAHEHNQVTYTAVQSMIIALGLLLAWVAVIL